MVENCDEFDEWFVILQNFPRQPFSLNVWPMEPTYDLGLGDTEIYCDNISWQKVSRYYYISRYFNFFSGQLYNGVHYSSGYIYTV